jgi:hypothetical protein
MKQREYLVTITTNFYHPSLEKSDDDDNNYTIEQEAEQIKEHLLRNISMDFEGCECEIDLSNIHVEIETDSRIYRYVFSHNGKKYNAVTERMRDCKGKLVNDEVMDTVVRMEVCLENNIPQSEIVMEEVTEEDD